jgi:hypothetical protein
MQAHECSFDARMVLFVGTVVQKAYMNQTICFVRVKSIIIRVSYAFHRQIQVSRLAHFSER